jgi:hypothetical protein
MEALHAAPVGLANLRAANLCEHLIGLWNNALSGDTDSRFEWQVGEGGIWEWSPEGVTVRNERSEWAGLAWQRCGPSVLGQLHNFIIQVTIRGTAEAAGLSFGSFKDFLVPISNKTGPRQLQLEVDGHAGTWAFRADGRLMTRQWWDSAVHGAGDLLSGAVTLKVRRGEEVLFSGFTVQLFASSCRLSVVMTCHRFLQRLRIVLRNWCAQTLPTGAWEIMVVNPQSPDGTAEHLAAVARSHPHVRVREIAVGAELATNKGGMINRALAACTGDWIWLTDADCLFDTNAASIVLSQIETRDHHLFYGSRRYLSEAQTDALLAGRIDGLKDFETLMASDALRPQDQSPWGYTQIFHRSGLARLRYREDLNHFAHSDDAFVEMCRRKGFHPHLVDGLFCLHLDHPFAWRGTRMFL